MSTAEIVFTLSCWSFTTLATIYNVFVLWGAFPRSSRYKSKLRAKALQNLEDADRSGFEKLMDKNSIEGAKSAEFIRMHVRFIKDYRATDLNVLVTRIRLSRSRLQTTLRATQLTADQIALWMKFNEIMKDFWNDGNGKDVMKRRNDVGRIAIYAMDHMDKGDDIYQLVERRHVYRLKDVKALLKNITETPSSALSDGFL